MYSDSLGFLDLEAKDPVADPALKLDLVHLTTSHPWPGPDIKNPTATLEEVRGWHTGYMEAIGRQSCLTVIKTRRDFAELKRGQTAIVAGLQNPPQDQIATKWMADEGIVFTTIAYNIDGAYGSGYYNQQGGLTGCGKEFLRQCANYGRILDLSHASHRTAFSVLNYLSNMSIPLEVVVTHAGVFDIYNNPRNLPMEILRRVIEWGGYIGVPMFMFFLDPDFNEMANEGLEPFAAHLKFLIDHFGDDQIGIGSDTPYKQYSLEEHKMHFKRLAGELDPEGKAIAAGRRMPELQHNHRYYSPNKMELVEAELLKYFPEKTVAKLLGNFWNWCVESLPA